MSSHLHFALNWCQVPLHRQRVPLQGDDDRISCHGKPEKWPPVGRQGTRAFHSFFRLKTERPSLLISFSQKHLRCLGSRLVASAGGERGKAYVVGDGRWRWRWTGLGREEGREGKGRGRKGGEGREGKEGRGARREAHGWDGVGEGTDGGERDGRGMGGDGAGEGRCSAQVERSMGGGSAAPCFAEARWEVSGAVLHQNRDDHSCHKAWRGLMLRFGLLICVCLFFLGCALLLLLGPRAHLVFRPCFDEVQERLFWLRISRTLGHRDSEVSAFYVLCLRNSLHCLFRPGWKT